MVTQYGPNFKLSQTIEASSRDYPCPECSDVIALDRVANVQFHSLLDIRRDEPDFLAYAKRNAALSLGGELLAKGFLRFQRGPPDDREMVASLVATVGVVSPTHVASLEKRVAQHQEMIAREVIAEAERQILNWNSHHSGAEGGIRKGQAVDELSGALKTVLARRSSIQTL